MKKISAIELRSIINEEVARIYRQRSKHIIQEGPGDWWDENIVEPISDVADEYIKEPLEEMLEGFIEDAKDDIKDRLEEYFEDNAADIGTDIAEKLPLPMGIGEDMIAEWLEDKIDNNAEEMADCIVELIL
jgi:hypothetical protein|tara:strand:- start:991 stop:1383 length:393 start_codon:yes stop_codon:yes gene_type:complete